MSNLRHVAASRALARYRIMFRASTMAFGAAVVFGALGLLIAVSESDPRLLAAAVLFAVMSVLNGYKIALSTMHLIDAQAGEEGWRELGM